MPKRMISTDISLSERVESCSPWAQLLFDRLIAHQDEWGRLVGNPAKVKAKVKPLDRHSTKQFEKALLELARARLICWYGGEEKYIALRPETCQDVQTNVHAKALGSKRTSKCPPPNVRAFRWPDEYELPENPALCSVVPDSAAASAAVQDNPAQSCAIPHSSRECNINLTEPNLTKPNVSSAPKPKVSEADRKSIIELYSEGYKKLAQADPIVDKADVMALTALLKKAPFEQVVETISFAVSGEYYAFLNKPCSLSKLCAARHFNEIRGVMARVRNRAGEQLNSRAGEQLNSRAGEYRDYTDYNKLSRDDALRLAKTWLAEGQGLPKGAPEDLIRRVFRLLGIKNLNEAKNF